MMRLPTLTTALLLLLTTTSAKPLPISFNEVEARWASGDSEQQIHSGLSHRDMTPAWPIARTERSSEFSAALDERTMRNREKRGTSTVVWDFLTGKRRREVQEEVLLRPRKEMRYYFSS